MRITSKPRIGMVLLFLMAATGLWILSIAGSGNSGSYIVDRAGEEWDVSQAESIGFTSSKFQYGIGRHAFTPLDDSYLQSDVASMAGNLRVIGVALANEAHAYSVSKLSRHETANTTIDTKPILVGY